MQHLYSKMAYHLDDWTICSHEPYMSNQIVSLELVIRISYIVHDETNHQKHAKCSPLCIVQLPAALWFWLITVQHEMCNFRVQSDSDDTFF